MVYPYTWSIKKLLWDSEVSSTSENVSTRQDSLQLKGIISLQTTYCVSKMDPDIFSYNSSKNCPIFIIFGTNIKKRSGNQK